MLVEVSVEGRKGLLAYFTKELEYTEDKKSAAFSKIVFDDGGSLWATLNRDVTVLGGHGSGNFGHEGRPGEKGGSSDAGGGTGRTERSERALKAFKPITAPGQRHAEANELHVRSMVGGTRTNDNLPVDVITTIGGKKHGIEVKTLINNTNNTITMRKAALQKKASWARKNKAIVHTVVIDDREKFNEKAHFSGHKIYYRRGAGSFRISAMVKVQSKSHLRSLLTGKKRI